MKLLALLLLVLACVCYTRSEGPPPPMKTLRKSSLKIELKSLKKLAEAALEQTKIVKSEVKRDCPTCEDECDESCLNKRIRRFEEPLHLLNQVISKLEKLASQKCPRKFWTDQPTITLDDDVSENPTLIP